jgi:hypothetical protein
MNTEELNKPLIISRVKNILLKSHKIDIKTKIKFFPNESNPNRINFACPICGDSENRLHEKRGNIWFNTLKFVCFNCDTKLSYLQFCDRMGEDIPADEKLQIYDHVEQNLTYSNSSEDYAIKSLDKLIDIDKWIEYMNSIENSWLVNIKPIQKNSAVYQYLKYDRLIDNFEYLLEGTYRVIKNGKVAFKTTVSITLNKHKNKLLGIQLRNLEKNKSKRFYKIVPFKELYDFINPDNILDDLEAISYNKLSHFYNILNVDFNRPVTVFEGYFDSYFFPNSIGLVGANNDNDLLNFILNADENIDIRFFYDNDEKGMQKAAKMITKRPVFLWKKLIETIAKKRNWYETTERFKLITDLNKLIIDSKNPNIYEKLKLYEFFSSDELDSIYLNQIEKKEYNKKAVY